MKPWRSVFSIVMAVLIATASGFFGFNYIHQRSAGAAEKQPELSREQVARVDDLASVFRYVGKTVGPSVVNINVTKKSSNAAGQRFHQMPFNRDQLRKFFRDRGMPDIPDLPDNTPDDEDATPELHGTGSGVIMEVTDGYGYILTNNHVAGGATAMEITLHDGRKITDAKVVGTDAKTDLAVIKIHADRLTPARWGNSDDLQQGDWVMAFGSPFGYVGSMTHGIVSSLHRQAGILGRQGYENFIQVDAPINPGNSGGPLVNIRGEVVGVNTAIASRTGAFSGIGFAIPSNQAKFVFESLKKSGKVVRGWLGVSISDVARDLPKAQSFGYQGTTGVLVEQLVPNTPAVGKLKVGDIIMAVNDKPVQNVQELRNTIASIAPNTEVTMKVFRNGKEEQVALKLGEQPETVALASSKTPGESGDTGTEKGASATKLGIRYSDATPEKMKEAGMTDVKSGAVVDEVSRGSLASKAGIASTDVITMVGQTEIKNAADLTKALANIDLKKGIRLYVTSKEPDTGQIMSRFVFIREGAVGD